MPLKSELEELRQHSLLVSEDGGRNLEFSVSWSINDIDLWLRRLLPKPFEWLDARLGKPTEGSFHWVLLNSERKKYFVLLRPTITGKELEEVKGSAGRKFSDCSIVIGMSSRLSSQNINQLNYAIFTSSSYHHPKIRIH